MMSPHLDLDHASNWSRPESLCTCETTNEDNMLFDYLVRKYTTSQINAKLKNARRSSAISSRSGSSSRSASSSIFSSLTSSSRRRTSRCSVHSSSNNLKRSQHDAELSSCIEEPHPGTKVNIIEMERIGTPVYQTPNQQQKQNNPSKQYLCPFCGEHQIENGISRESDLVKHFKTYHSTNHLWVCRKGNCGKAFDFHGAYKAHLNDKSHPTEPVAPGSVRVLLQTQVVFACGFEGCKQVYEVDPMEFDTTQTLKDYFSHVINHMKRFINRKAPCPWEEAPVWSYSTRIRNLLRQSQVRNAWKDIGKDDRKRLQWRVEESTVLCKMLECRDVTDVKTIVLAAQELGTSGSTSSSSSSPLRMSMKKTIPAPPRPKASANLVLPIQDDGLGFPDDGVKKETATLDEKSTLMHSNSISATVFTHSNNSDITYTSLERQNLDGPSPLPTPNSPLHHTSYPLSCSQSLSYALPHHLHHHNQSHQPIQTWHDNIVPTYFPPPTSAPEHQQQHHDIEPPLDPLWLMHHQQHPHHAGPYTGVTSRDASFDMNNGAYTDMATQTLENAQARAHAQAQAQVQQWYVDAAAESGDVAMGSPPR
jgi:hypothetical protein